MWVLWNNTKKKEECVDGGGSGGDGLADDDVDVDDDDEDSGKTTNRLSETLNRNTSCSLTVGSTRMDNTSLEDDNTCLRNTEDYLMTQRHYLRRPGRGCEQLQPPNCFVVVTFILLDLEPLTT